MVCKAYATPPGRHDQHKSLHESHMQGQVAYAEFTAPPLQCPRVIGWEPIGGKAIGFLPLTATHRCHALTVAFHGIAWQQIATCQ
jgi:hypothetical protein